MSNGFCRKMRDESGETKRVNFHKLFKIKFASFPPLNLKALISEEKFHLGESKTFDEF